MSDGIFSCCQRLKLINLLRKRLINYFVQEDEKKLLAKVEFEWKPYKHYNDVHQVVGVPYYTFLDNKCLKFVLIDKHVAFTIRSVANEAKN